MACEGHGVLAVVENPDTIPAGAVDARGHEKTARRVISDAPVAAGDAHRGEHVPVEAPALHLPIGVPEVQQEGDLGLLCKWRPGHETGLGTRPRWCPVEWSCGLERRVSEGEGRLRRLPIDGDDEHLTVRARMSLVSGQGGQHRPGQVGSPYLVQAGDSQKEPGGVVSGQHPSVLHEDTPPGGERSRPGKAAPAE